MIDGVGLMASPVLHLRSIDGLHIGGEILELRGIPARDVVGVPANPPRRSDQNGFHAAGQPLRPAVSFWSNPWPASRFYSGMAAG